MRREKERQRGVISGASFAVIIIIYSRVRDWDQ